MIPAVLKQFKYRQPKRVRGAKWNPSAAALSPVTATSPTCQNCGKAATAPSDSAATARQERSQAILARQVKSPAKLAAQGVCSRLLAISRADRSPRRTSLIATATEPASAVPSLVRWSRSGRFRLRLSRLGMHTMQVAKRPRGCPASAPMRR